MPSIDMTREKFRSGASKAGSGARSLFHDFKAFLAKGNIIDLAVAVILGAAFTAVVNSFVEDLISPIIGLLVKKNLSQAYLPIKCGPNVTISCRNIDGIMAAYPTISQANEAGIVTWNYGNFIQQIINLLIVGLILFSLVKMYSSASSRKKVRPFTTKDCIFCCREIPIKAQRCPFCTSVMDQEVMDIVNGSSSSISIAH